ncbi:MAG: hypothetical protein KDJ65_01585 [Anaerolineae bacterium]|nr:hypothetical protein [Anaerolineae bacterium]
MNKLIAPPPPAKGLTRLWWSLIEDLDAKASSLCSLTEASKGEARLVIVIKNGKIRFIEQVISEAARLSRDE